jgi:protein-disulfide isomerase/uncharacterized membrane protein
LENERTARWPLVVALVLCALGIAVSVYLSYIHYFVHTDPAYHSVCAIDAKINCETVAQSPYSVVFGLPVSAWGLTAYVLFAALCVWGLVPRRLHVRWPRGLLFAVSVLGLAASAALAYISFFRIESLCLFCLSLYGINLLLLGATVAALITARRGPLSTFVADLVALFRRPLALVAVGLPPAAAIALLLLLLPPYWHHPGWHDLPRLPAGITEQGHHWIGATEPLVEVVEFSDYQCPFCRRAHKNMRVTAAKFPGAVRLVHRHMPLDSACNNKVENPFHDRACEFAKAVECAAEQDRFWQMSDAVFSVQDHVRAADVDLERLAGQVELDVVAFGKCMKAGRVLRKVRADLNAAYAKEVVGTPTYFIRNQQFPGGISEGILKRRVESARERKARQPDGSEDEQTK